MPTVRLARMAMASRFELVLQGDDEVWLRAAGEEALAEIARLDRQLTIYSAASEVSRINARAADGPVRVEPRLFELLKQAKRYSEMTDGAFDVTVAPLMRAWGFFRGSGRIPDEETLQRARSVTGMHLVHLDETDRTIHFEREGVMLDLGAIGKGYAVDEAVRLLREAGVERAFLHGGTSTAFGIGSPLDDDAWKVAVSYPGEERSSEKESILALAPLDNMSLSVSAVWGKAFESGPQVYGHVLDSRQGQPVEGALLTAAVSSSATEADALSTALLVEGRRCGAIFQRVGSGVRALIVFPSAANGKFEIIEHQFRTLPSNRHQAGSLRS